MTRPNKPPAAVRPGYRWEYRAGCDCPLCPWGASCRGRGGEFPHWIEVLIKDEGTGQ